jgi:replicative DNA helicase
MNLQEINQRVKEIEGAWKNGETDYTEATHLINETLKDYSGDDRVIPFKDYKIPNGLPKNHITTGIDSLDKMIGGFGKGDIILISGDTGDGKTTFSRFLIKKLTEQEKKSLVFSYEESNEEFLSKFVGELPDGYLPNILLDKSPVWIEARVLEAVLKYKIEIVIIDNLKGIIDHESRRSDVGEVDFIIQRLKEVARKYNVVLILLAHIKKLDNGLIDKNSLTGSKSIVDTASVGIALRRNEVLGRTKKDIEDNGKKFSNFTTFYLIKNRYKGKYDNFNMLYYPDTGLYVEKNPDKKDKDIIDQEEINKMML